MHSELGVGQSLIEREGDRLLLGAVLEWGHQGCTDGSLAPAYVSLSRAYLAEHLRTSRPRPKLDEALAVAARVQAGTTNDSRQLKAVSLARYQASYTFKKWAKVALGQVAEKP